MKPFSMIQNGIFDSLHFMYFRVGASWSFGFDYDFDYIPFSHCRFLYVRVVGFNFGFEMKTSYRAKITKANSK